jgi:predicted amidohydrolase YtcJ
MNCQKEIVLRNAVLWADNPIKKIMGGMRIRDGRILEICPGETQAGAESVVDLQGMHVIPGLIDAHRHFFISSLLPMHGDASAWRSKSDALAAIESACGPEKRWVFFSGLDNSKWKRPYLPEIQEIDAASFGSPVLVVDSTCHRGLISTAALRRTGINRNALRIPSDIDIRKNGTPDGGIWEDALGRILFYMYREIFQTFSEEEKRKIILNEADRCLRMGLTHVNDPGVPSDVQRLLTDAQMHTPLKISWCVTGYESFLAPPELKDEMESLHSDHAPKSVKFFLDGANRTAATMPVIAGLKAAIRAAKDSLYTGSVSPFYPLLSQKSTLREGKIYLPYLRFEDTKDLIRRARFFTEKGYRLVMHALGNVAASQAAQVVTELGMAGNSSIEHVLIMDEKGMDAFARCGAIASVQPGFIPSYADTIEKMGAVPYMKAFALKSFMDRGVSVCISSDGPCGADDPLHNIRRAVDRKKQDGTVFDEDEKISQTQALAAGTFGGSASLGMKNKGLNAGEPATFCIVDGDPFLDTSRVVQTWIDGKKAFLKNEHGKITP